MATSLQDGRFTRCVHILQADGTSALKRTICARVRVAYQVREACLTALAVKKILFAANTAYAAGCAVIWLLRQVSIKRADRAVVFRELNGTAAARSGLRLLVAARGAAHTRHRMAVDAMH